jgi:hypothetical protein
MDQALPMSGLHWFWMLCAISKPSLPAVSRKIESLYTSENMNALQMARIVCTYDQRSVNQPRLRVVNHDLREHK